MVETFDVAIIGGGPAGQAAALEIAGSNLSVVVCDEQARPGGQILRQRPSVFGSAGWLPGRSYRDLKARTAAFEALPLDWRGGRSVLGIMPSPEGFALDAAGPDGVERFAARRVLVAAGCQDLAVPLPGWTLPGVMAAGGLQAFIKAQAFVPGQRILLAGTHPLMLLIADQIIAAGGTVAGVFFAQPRRQLLGAMAAHPAAAISAGGPFRDAASAWLRLRQAGVAIRFGASLARISGATRVEGVVLAAGESVLCDCVGLCFGFVPQAELVRAAGAQVRVAGPAGGWAATHDAWMQSSVPGLFVAGETTGVGGAPAAAATGAIAGLGMALTLGAITDAVAITRAAPHRREHRHRMAFAALLDAAADPRAHWPLPDATTLACRCEDVSFGALETTLPMVASADAAKLITRCGMGLCQGRNCEPTLLRLLARCGIDDPGFAARYPARPVAIGDLLG